MKIGNKLKGIRVGKEISVEEISDLAGIDISTYRRYERDETSPNLNTLEKIAKALDVSVLDIIPDGLSQLNNNQSGGVALAYNSTINQLSEKLIEQYENRIQELNDLIKQLIKSDN